MTSPMTQTKQDVQIQTDVLDYANVRSILLADGWHDVSNCQPVHFAVAEAHSPLSPSKLYPAIRYESDGRMVRTTLDKVLSWSDEPYGESASGSRTPRTSGAFAGS